MRTSLHKRSWTPCPVLPWKIQNSMSLHKGQPNPCRWRMPSKKNLAKILASKKTRTSPERSACEEKERGSADPASLDDLGNDHDVFKNLPQIKDEEA